MIFVHGVIPHLHVDEVTGCHQVVCKADLEDHQWDGKLKIRHQPEDDTVCHISGLLFSQLNQDNILFHSEKAYKLCPLSLSGHILNNSEHAFVPELYYDTISLRAPPVA